MRQQHCAPGEMAERRQIMTMPTTTMQQVPIPSLLRSLMLHTQSRQLVNTQEQR